MKPFLSAALAASLYAASAAAMAQTPASGSLADQCDIGYVTGVGGSAQSLKEYLATRPRDQYRYLADNAIQCQVSSDEGRASGCTGLTSLRHEKVSVYQDIDSSTMAVVARVELDQGTYPVIIVVQKKDVQCEQ